MQNIDSLKKQFDKDGFCIVRNLLNNDEVNLYKKILEEKSGVKKHQFESQNAFKFFVKNKKKNFGWKQSNGIVNFKEFWPLIWNEKLIGILKKLLDDDVKFLQHNDIHVGFSAIGWHRDSSDREYMVGPEWDESDEAFQLVRVGIYLQKYEESNFKLGVLPGSNKHESSLTTWELTGLSKLGLLGTAIRAIRYLLIGPNLFSKKSYWFKPNPGDAIIFDPRVYHRGTFIKGPKYSMFMGYGRPGRHFDRLTEYFNKKRTDLKYSEMPTDLKEKLKEKNLLAS
jgi:hypothetical protein